METERKDTQLLSEKNLKWLLYGAGFENLGKNGRPEAINIPNIKSDELLLRVDVVSLCFSDIKVINLGNRHPRVLNRDLVNNPVVLGHEASVTVVKVGEQRKELFQPGERYVIQPDIYYHGKPETMGYVIEGALQQYIVAGREILDSDGGCNLLPLGDSTGYSESALCEPWSCVEAAYNIRYRDVLKKDGTAWFIGNKDADFDHYRISTLVNDDNYPAIIIVSGIKGKIHSKIKEAAKKYNIELVETNNIDSPSSISEKYNNGKGFDDIIILGIPRPEFIEEASETMASKGVLAIISDKPIERKVNIDVGRIHYDGLLFTGTDKKDLSFAYSNAIISPKLKKGGSAWFVGAGGPLGQMHVQRAVEMDEGPSSILATDINDKRIDEIRLRYEHFDTQEQFSFSAHNPDTMSVEDFNNLLTQTCGKSKFDNIVIMAPAPALIAQGSDWLGENGVLNVFAGIPKGTKVKMDINGCFLRGQKWVGSSGTSLQFMIDVLKKIEKGELTTNRSVAAIGGLNSASEGLQAVKAGSYPGKVIIYPQIIDMPLIPISNIPNILPGIAEKLANGRYWTGKAEKDIMESPPVFNNP